MAFTIYSLGDTQLFAEILNGIAMLFSNGDLVHGNNPLNLGFGAFFGATLLLCVLVYKSVFQRHIDIKMLLTPLIIYMVLTIPKTDLIVDDLYRIETPKMISNIPIGLAIPASIVSGMGKLLAETLEAVLYVVPTNSFSSETGRVLDSGFLTPLQVLNAMRFDELSQNHPMLQQAFNQIYATCVSTNEQFSFLEYKRAPDSFKYIISKINEASGLVTVHYSEAGESVAKKVSCSTAGSHIEAAIHAHMTGDNDVSSLLGGNYKNNTFASQLNKALAIKGTVVKNSNNSNIRYSMEQINEMAANASGLQIAQSRAFMTSIIFDPVVNSAAKCLDEYGASEISKCTSYITSKEQWKESSAATATSFFTNLRNGQNVLIVVGFMLFPIVVFMVMLQGLGSIKLVAGYMIFMVTNYLWIPFAVIINYYSQFSFQEALYQMQLTNPSGALTLSEAPHFFEAVTTKLGVANNTIGMIPMFTTMLFGGSMWVMNSFAKQINPAGSQYNAKNTSPSIMNSSSLSTSSSLVNKNGMAPTVIVGAISSQVKHQSTISAQSAEIQTYQDSISQGISRLKQIESKNSNKESNSISRSIGDNREKVSAISEEDNLSKGTTNDAKADLSGSYENNIVEKSDAVSLKAESLNTRERNLNVGAGGNASLDVGKVIGEKRQGSNFFMSILKGGNIGVDFNLGSVNAQTSRFNTVQAQRSIVGTDTEEPTYNTKNAVQSGVTTASDDNVIWSGESATYKTTGSNSSDSKAEKLNESIQNSKSSAITTQDKMEASQILSQIKEMSDKKSQVESMLLSINISSNDIAGLTSEFSRNNAQIMNAFSKADHLGSTSVENWEKLKENGRNIAIKGGQTDSNAIEAIAVYSAARLSGNKDVGLAVMYAVIGKEYSEKLGQSGLLSHGQLDKDFNSEKERVAKILPKFNNDDGVEKKLDDLLGFDYRNILEGVQANVVPTTGLLSQELRNVIKMESDRDSLIPPDYNEMAKVIMDNYIENKKTASNEIDALLKALPETFNNTAFRTDLTQMEKDLQAAKRRGDHDAAAEISVRFLKVKETLVAQKLETQTAMIDQFSKQNAMGTIDNLPKNSEETQAKLNSLAMAAVLRASLPEASKEKQEAWKRGRDRLEKITGN